MKTSIKIYFIILAGAMLLDCSKTETPAPTTTPVVITPTIKAFIPDGWKSLDKFLGGVRSNAVSFSIGDKIYVGTGYSSSQGFNDVSKDFYEYDPATNRWKAIAEFPGSSRANAIAFAINGKGYVGLGTNYDRQTRVNLFNDFYEYDPTSNKWTKKADFTGTLRDQPIYFTIGNKGYFGTGNVDPASPFVNTNEFWEYDASSDTWTKKAQFAGLARCRAFGFALGGKGYVGGGEDNTTKKLDDFYEYDPATDKWNRKGAFTSNISRAVGFSVGDYGYVAGGITGATASDNNYFKYEPKTDTWTVAGEMAAVDDTKKGRFYSSCVPYKGKAYIGLGSRFVEGNNLSDFYEVTVK